MDFDKFAEDLFDNSAKEIKVTNASKCHLEWKLLWDMMFNYKEFRESKDRIQKKEIKD